MMTCTTPCEAYSHRQGRCECGTNASRAALGLPPLHQDDGGHEVSGRYSFPLHRAADWSEQDEPILTMDPLEYAIWGVIVASLVAIVVGVSAALGAYLPQFAF